jgi:hypothetical protein
VTPGSNGVFGKITIVGNYTQENTGGMVINMDSTGNISQLIVAPDPARGVGGTVNLAGSLAVNNNGYKTTKKTDLVFLLYKTLAGAFGNTTITNQGWTDSVDGGTDKFIVQATTPLTLDLLAVAQ